MYFLVKSLQMGLTVVYENVQQETTWVFAKTGSRKLEGNLAFIPELNSTKTIHIFDAKAASSREMRTVTGGAYQVAFSSTNIVSYKQLIRNSDLYVALFPSLSIDEFLRFGTLFQKPKSDLDEVIKIHGYGKVRPLANIITQTLRLNNAIESFNPENIGSYASAENVSRNSNPAILLNTYPCQELDMDEDDLSKLHNAYFFGNCKWNFASVHIVDKLYKKFGTQADQMVWKLYRALGDKYTLTVGPLIGRLFEHCAVQPEFIPAHGLAYERIKTYTKFEQGNNDKHNENEFCTVGKGFKLVEYQSSNVDQIVRDCNKPSIIYNIGGNQPLFDAYIYPNLFISFTSSMQNKPGRHAADLKAALQCCVAMERMKLPVIFITAVPFAQKHLWGKVQSFNVNIPEVVLVMRKNGDKTVKEGSERAFWKLPQETKSKLATFHPHVGTVASIQRHYWQHSTRKFSTVCSPRSNSFCVLETIFRRVNNEGCVHLNHRLSSKRWYLLNAKS